MIDDDIDPTSVDFSDESIDEAETFVRSAIATVIDTLKAELDWLGELKRTDSPHRRSILIALANQYRDAAGFQQRWNLQGEK
jgi:hypothetical protein